MIPEAEHPVAQHSYTVEQMTGTILLMAIKQNYIKRENLTALGEKLVSEAEKYEQDSDLH